ncbi:UNVERIFIED_CONTAM: hypothetical protein FKN15_061242 [Acipenser sinensis]
MKLLLGFMVVFLVLAELFCEEAGTGEDLNYWTDSNQIQDEWLAPDSFKEILKRIIRKPKPHQFFGLMGKRSSGQKLNSFVGLMGKRSEEPGQKLNSFVGLMGKRSEEPGQKLNSFVGLMGKRSEEPERNSAYIAAIPDS